MREIASPDFDLVVPAWVFFPPSEVKVLVLMFCVACFFDEESLFAGGRGKSRMFDEID